MAEGDMESDSTTALLKEDQCLTLKKEIFYKEEADTTVRLKDEKLLKFNKAALCITSGSIALYELFLGKIRAPDETYFNDIDYDTFKLFLDCIMGFEPYTFENADQIFQVAWKYQTENAIDQCIKAMTPKKMTEKTVENLNMAVFCECNKLIHEITCFIWFIYSPYKLLEKDAYCHLLEPDSMKVILSMPDIIIDSNVLMPLKKWLDFYMKNNYTGLTVKSFLEKYELSQFFKLEYFETTSAISKFCLSETGKAIFPTDDVLTHLENAENLIHGKSKWEKIKKDGSITEDIICFTMPTSGAFTTYNCRINVERNKIVAYGNVTVEDGSTVGEGTCSIILWGQDENGLNLFHITQEEFRFSYNETPENSRNYYVSCSGRANVQNNQLKKCTLRITWKFTNKCRVLLVNRPGDQLNGSKKFYFTKNVSASF